MTTIIDMDFDDEDHDVIDMDFDDEDHDVIDVALLLFTQGGEFPVVGAGGFMIRSVL
jgi:hypothetical protein